MTKVAEKFKETWISLGNYLILADEIDSVAVQAGHIIITFSQFYKPHGNFPGQIVLHFGEGEKGNEQAIAVYDQLCKVKEAIKISLPKRYDAAPDLSKTYYRETIDREVKRGVAYVTSQYDQNRIKYRERHQRKLEQALAEIQRLRDIYEVSEKK